MAGWLTWKCVKSDAQNIEIICIYYLRFKYFTPVLKLYTNNSTKVQMKQHFNSI